MQHILNVAAVVVLYNPEDNVYENILSYIDQVDVVYAVDNSEGNSATSVLIRKNEKIVYLPNGRNLGIATALNIGAGRGVDDGYDYLLTMDQDSSATPGMVQSMLECLRHHNGSEVGIISPYHLTDVNTPPVGLPDCEEVLTAWTSGNLLNLKIYSIVGPFMDGLFIDFVDHEYCLRLQSQGYKVLQANNAILIHKIGTNLKKNKFLYLTLITSNHSYFRRYYITRNRFWVCSRYGNGFPVFVQIDRKRFVAELVNILFFEQDRWRKYKMIFKGYLDYRRGKMGRLVVS
jgi:rhamnosyltransferase